MQIISDEIISIEETEELETYDIELESEPHNFFADDFLVHNSHSFAYAMIGYYCQFLKVYYPTEFICASLTCGSEGAKEGLVKEAYRLGLSIISPKCKISDPFKWVAKNKKLFVPFVEVKGIGQKTALKAAEFEQSKSKPIRILRTGFFDSDTKREYIGQSKSKFEETLEKIGAFDSNSIPKGIGEYFSFKISNDPKIMYPKLYSLVGNVRPKDFDEALKGRLPMSDIFQKKRCCFNEVVECENCDLTDECIKPVPNSRGMWNIAIVGEGPGKDEDIQGKGFVGQAGNNILWPEFNKYRLERKHFHVTNCVKCFPSKTKTPKKEHIEACW
ncbi:MAG: hypothetical protein KKH44_08470, partial [Bacteroidetes bacterium]|nr:hypothetical protein [Bacteroidota bacterium]